MVFRFQSFKLYSRNPFLISEVAAITSQFTNIFSKPNRLKNLFNIMSAKTKQKKMADYVTIKTDNSKKRARESGDEDSKSKKPKSKQYDINKINYHSDKKNANGQTWNFKLLSWNVAGMRAWVKKDVIAYLKKEDADIICLQEIKCTEKQIPDESKLSGYNIYVNPADKAGYSGVALYSKIKPIKVRLGKEIEELDDSEGRVIEAEYENFILVATYVPNSGNGLKSLPKRMKWDDEFRDYLKQLDEKKPVILAGDLNVAHEEIDLANPKANGKSAGFTKEERDNFSVLLDEGFVDTFRSFYPDKAGAYTYWTYFRNARSNNIGWRLDYFVLSKKLMKNVCDSIMRNEVLGSDHCPIVLYVHV